MKMSVMDAALVTYKALKINDALDSGNWQAVIKILSTYSDYEKRTESDCIGFHAAHSNCYIVIEFLVRERWPIDLDRILGYAINAGKRSLETVDKICRLGAEGDISAYRAAHYRLNDQVAIYGILLEHNMVTPRMLFCEDKDSDGNKFWREIRLLIFWLDISGDCCRKRRSWASDCDRVGDDEYGDVLDIVELCAGNGVPIAVQPSLLEQLPQAGPRVSAIMAAALQPASLHSLCRKAIRQVGPKSTFKSWVQELGLPKRLSGYLCSSEV